MLVSEVRALVRTLTDEADLTFLTEAKLTSLLLTAYNEFRELVTSTDDSYYVTTYNFAAPNATSQTLDGTLLGATATQPRLTRISQVLALDVPNGTPIQKLTAASSMDELFGRPGYGVTSWWLQGRVLRFSTNMARPFQVQYIPVSTLTWSTGTDYIDDLNDYHDIIALLAMNGYNIMNGSADNQHSVQLQRRLKSLRSYLNTSRSGEASRYVSQEDGGW